MEKQAQAYWEEEKNVRIRINRIIQKIEQVNNIKYLGYLFNENNNHNKHKITQIKKVKRIILLYTTWSAIKRASLRDLNNKIYLFESLIKSIIMCGVEIKCESKNRKDTRKILQINNGGEEKHNGLQMEERDRKNQVKNKHTRRKD